MRGEVVVASGNAGKVEELRSMLAELPLTLRLQSDFSVRPAAETGTTFIENALLKARAVSEQTGLPALADDSGLAVDALGGAPGVYSARYASDSLTAEQSAHNMDSANNHKLLDALADVDDAQRGARFICVLVLLRHPLDPVPLIAEGEWAGSILREPRGEGGFGYDPLFCATGSDRSAAQLPPAEKNRISHRALAVAALRRRLLDV